MKTRTVKILEYNLSKLYKVSLKRYFSVKKTPNFSETPNEIMVAN